MDENLISLLSNILQTIAPYSGYDSKRSPRKFVLVPTASLNTSGAPLMLRIQIFRHRSNGEELASDAALVHLSKNFDAPAQSVHPSI